MSRKSARWIIAIAGLVLLLGCTDNDVLQPGGLSGAGEVVVVVTSDYVSGQVTTLQDGGNKVSLNLLRIHNDSAVFAHGQYAYVVEKQGGDNVIKVRAEDIGPSGVVYQYSVGNGANPQEMAFVSDQKAYVTRYGATSLWIVNPSATSEPGFKLGEVDLSAYADADGLPEMCPMALAEGKLYVGCQRMDESGFPWTPLDALVVVIDVATDQVTGTIPLQHGNPQAMVAHGGRLYVTCTQDAFNAADGAIEVIDTATDTHARVLVTEADLGGNVTVLAVRSPAKAYVIAGAYDANWQPQYWVYPFDPTSGAVGTPLPGASAATSLALGTDGVLYVADRSTEQPGVYAYDGSDSLISGPISTGLPPNALVVVGGR